MNSARGTIRSQTHGDGRHSSIACGDMTTRLQRGFIARWTHPRPTHCPRTPARTTRSNACATLRGCRGQCGRSNDHRPPRDSVHSSTIAHTINVTAACTHTLPHSTPARTAAWRAHTQPATNAIARTHTRTLTAAITIARWVYSQQLISELGSHSPLRLAFWGVSAQQT